MHCLPKHATLSSRVAPAEHPRLVHALLCNTCNAALGAKRRNRKEAATSLAAHQAATAGRSFSFTGAVAVTRACNSTQQDAHQQEVEALIVHCNDQLLLLEQLADDLQAADLQPGPQLLELLSVFEITRSNLLRPAGYFADFLQPPEQQLPWKQLMQRVGELTGPVYENSTILQQLLETVAQSLQQLAAVAATAIEEQSSPSMRNGTGGGSNHKRQQACGSHWQSQFTQVQPGLAVALGAVAVAAELAQHACKLLRTSLDDLHSSTSGASVSLAALQMCLTAVDAVVHSTVPSSSTYKHSTDRHISSNSSSSAMQQLMVCRRLLAVSWLPPLAAAAAASAALQPQDAPNEYPDPVQPAAIEPAMQDAAADGGSCSMLNHCAVQPTTRQLLRSASATLSAVSNSTVHNSTVAPLLLMTDDQAGVIKPLLQDAGLQHIISSASAAAKQHIQPDSTAELPPGRNNIITTPWVPLSVGPVQQHVRHYHVGPSDPTQVLQASTLDSDMQASCNSWLSTNGEAFPAVQCTPIAAADLSGGVLVRTDAVLRVHEGADGLLHLEGGLFSMTEDAEQLLQYWQQEQQPQQQQQQWDASIKTNACADRFGDLQATDVHGRSSSAQTVSQLLLPCELPLQLLRLSNDVIQVLLRHHPHQGVRQQIYHSGLLPQLQLQQQVLTVVLSLRQRLASEHATASYTQLVLSGSCLGTAAVAKALLNQLQPVIRKHAEAEYQELQHMSARKARAQGKWGECDLAPWDSAHAIQELVQQVNELDWGRDFAPYFTLPGLITRIDSLLASTCGLRLLPAESVEDYAAAEGNMEIDPKQQQQRSPTSSSIQLWGDHVLHLILLDADYLALVDQMQQEQQLPLQQQQLVLGHVFVELVSGCDFPFCSLLRLPAAAYSSSKSCSTNGSRCGSTADDTAAPPAPAPGSVVIRLPIPAAERIVGFGSKQSTASQQQQHIEDAPPLLLPGPAALQALLHELGHALSYLCPYATVQQRLFRKSGCTVGSSNSSTDGGKITDCSAEGWLFNSSVGVHGLCLLAGPADGLDIRELSSHLFEHWVRHPVSLMALSCHERLGVPLPQRAALQLPQMLLATSAACNSMHLHHLLLEAAADLELHSKGTSNDSLNGSSGGDLHFRTTSSTAPNLTAAVSLDNNCLSDTAASAQPEQVPSNSASQNLPRTKSAAQKQQQQQRRAGCSTSLQEVRTALQQQLVPPDGAVLDEVDELAACGPVGGAKAAYIMAMLLAAATWKTLGLEQQPTGSVSRSSSSNLGLALYASGCNHPGGRWMKDVLLSSLQPGHWTVMQVLGADEDVLEPVFRPLQCPWLDGTLKHQQQSHASDQASSAGQPAECCDTGSVANEAGRLVVVGWMPSLVHDVYQDIELV